MRLMRNIKISTIFAACAFIMTFCCGAFAEDDVQIKVMGQGKKKVSMVITEIGRNNPFEPIFGGYDEDTSVYLEAPPELPGLDNDALDVIKTRVTGIIFDKNGVKSSAILNVGGTDYLTRVGDTVNGYMVKDIDKSDITVQLGANVFKAAVGDVIEDDNLYDVNKTQTPDLEHKFAGRNK